MRTPILGSCGKIGHTPLRSQKTVGWPLRADCDALGLDDYISAQLMAFHVLDEAGRLAAWKDLHPASQLFEDPPSDLRVCLDE